MAEACFYYVTADQRPLMIWPDGEGLFLVQIGPERPWRSDDQPRRFAQVVTDILPKAVEIESNEWHSRMAEQLKGAPI